MADLEVLLIVADEPLMLLLLFLELATLALSIGAWIMVGVFLSQSRIGLKTLMNVLKPAGLFSLLESLVILI